MDPEIGEVVMSRDDWVAIIQEQARSGRTAAGFCRDRGITYTNFLYHRGKILRKRGQSPAPTESGSAVSLVRSKGFIPIRIGGRCGIRLCFPRGLVVESDQLPEAAWLVEVAERWIGEKKSC